jgi:hypothetical protein
VTVTRPGFGILAIVHEHKQSALARVVTYTSLTASRVDFPSYTPVGQFMTLVFGQGSTIGGAIPESVKVIERKTAESMTQALDAASDFYAVATPSKVNADIEAGAAWALANNRLFGYSSPDTTAITATTTDPFAVIQALSNSRAAGWYSEDAGGEFAIDSITVVGTVATADLTTHGSVPVKVGDKVWVWDSAVTALNAQWTVATVGANDFTFTVPTGTASDATASEGFFDGNWLEAAIFGKMLPQDAGAKTWDIQNLAGVTVDGAAGTNSTKLTGTGQTNLGGKNGNWFADLAGVNVTSGLKTGGGGGKTASGRYIDIQRGSDWLKINLQLDLAQLMIQEGGELGYDAVGFQKVETAIALRLDDGLEKKFLTPFTSGTFAGQDYNIAMPDLADVPAADKTNRLLSGILINANIRGKIHNIEATLTLST